MQTAGAYCAVRTGLLYAIHVTFLSFKGSRIWLVILFNVYSDLFTYMSVTSNMKCTRNL